MMILFGSEGAKRSGFLPSWRDPLTVNDYDLCGSDEEFEALAKHLEQYGSVMTADRPDNHKAIFVHDRMNRLISVDWLSEGHRTAKMVTDGSSTVFGLPVALVDAGSHLVTKRAYPHRSEKTVADQAFFEALNPVLDDRHLALEQAVIETYLM